MPKLQGKQDTENGVRSEGKELNYTKPFSYSLFNSSSNRNFCFRHQAENLVVSKTDTVITTWSLVGKKDIN